MKRVSGIVREEGKVLGHRSDGPILPVHVLGELGMVESMFLEAIDINLPFLHFLADLNILVLDFILVLRWGNLKGQVLHIPAAQPDGILGLGSIKGPVSKFIRVCPGFSMDADLDVSMLVLFSLSSELFTEG